MSTPPAGASPDANPTICASTRCNVDNISFTVPVNRRTSLGPRTGNGSNANSPSPINRARGFGGGDRDRVGVTITVVAGFVVAVVLVAGFVVGGGDADGG